MSDISIFNDKINIEIIDPGVVIRMCYFVKDTLGKRDDFLGFLCAQKVHTSTAGLVTTWKKLERRTHNPLVPGSSPGGPI